MRVRYATTMSWSPHGPIHRAVSSSPSDPVNPAAFPEQSSGTSSSQTAGSWSHKTGERNTDNSSPSGPATQAASEKGDAAGLALISENNTVPNKVNSSGQIFYYYWPRLRKLSDRPDFLEAYPVTEDNDLPNINSFLGNKETHKSRIYVPRCEVCEGWMGHHYQGGSQAYGKLKGILFYLLASQPCL